MKNRLFSELKKHILICAIGFLYYLLVLLTDFYIPCVFKMITGLKCPGCGITRMIMAIFRLDFSAAFRSNQLLFVALPPMGMIYITKKVHYIRTGTKMSNGKILNFTAYLFIVVLVIFGIARNLPIN